MAEPLNDAYLDLLVEECGEVLQAVGKCRRFGPRNRWRTGERNFVVLAEEIGGLLEVIDRLGLDPALIEEGRAMKIESLKTFAPEIWTPEVGRAFAEREDAMRESSNIRSGM